ncbi:hypothetical protein DMN91_006688 [Ooceraea biroi]|uniref:Multiple inositol polyphosphate phosphatase 1 n=1 Tax=Ooceraea biroi TaxID=2015173 RepID=A0A3L8DIQ1_OOCBI|nr:hypothetical protein DMN91_006688 [Ooceraea biroi]
MRALLLPLIASLLACSSIRSVLARDADFCFADEDDPYLYMATKTAYHFVHGGKTRFQNVPNGHMCNRDLENLRRWRPDEYLAPQRAEVLTPQGVEDMRLLARRLQSNFPELLLPSASNITSANYKFRATEARDSMASFMEGLFGSRTAILPEESSLNDTLLTAYKTCSVWENDKDVQPFENTEGSKFDAGPELQNLLRNAWAVTKLSPWCAVFSKDELRILEYREDLYYYYKAGYGRDINSRLGCPLLHDMMQHFCDVISLQNLLTTMGINEDPMPLAAFNFKDMARRQWRTSMISPFAGNLVAVFYKCNDITDRNKVMFYLAEKPVRYEGCQVGLCDWQFLKSKFGELASSCKLDICWKGNTAPSSFPNSIAVLLAYAVLCLGYRQL